MTSRFRVLEKARTILETRPYCMYHDPRFPHDGIARRKDGIVTSPENKPAVMFTPTGAVARALFEMTGENWIIRHDLYISCMQPLYNRTTLNSQRFLRLSDEWGREKMISLISEVLRI